MKNLVEIARRGRRALEKAIAPDGNVSYAQAGEDLVLDFLTGHKPNGFYVDVGCNRPRQGSNSYRFYRKGWSGIVIDANPDFARQFAAVRPRDLFVNACVSDVQGEVDFHIFAGDSLSSISGNSLYDDPKQYEVHRVDRVVTRRLDDILETAKAPAAFDFLSIDVEGHDEAVLRSINLDRFTPHVIVVELNDTGFDPGRIADSATMKRLGALGYEPIAMHWHNLFLRKNKG
jgi:FkbM family methyltransferase